MIDTERITLDMGLIKRHLQQFVIRYLPVRLSDAERIGLSNWSDRFHVLRCARSCALVRPTPTPTPPTDQFPPMSAPFRSVAGDLPADVIVRKPDLAQIAAKSVVPFKAHNPTGVVVDLSTDPSRGYVWGSGNGRILGIHLGKYYDGPRSSSAGIVVSQPSGYDHTACNRNNGVQNIPFRALPNTENLRGICGYSLSPWETYSFVAMAVDYEGTFYVPDSIIHRVLQYRDPLDTDSVVEQVWGQADFSGMVCERGALESPAAQSLCFHSDSVKFMSNRYGPGMKIVADGNLRVADVGNNRTPHFPMYSRLREKSLSLWT